MDITGDLSAIIETYVSSALSATGTRRSIARGTKAPPPVAAPARAEPEIAEIEPEPTQPDALMNLFAVETDDEITAVFTRP